MTGRMLMLAAAMMTTALSSGVALGDTADTAAPAGQAFASGNALVLKGEFEQALRAYKEAVRLAPDQQDYRQHYVLLRRIVQLQQNIEEQGDSAKWRSMAGGLRAFYYENKLYDKALVLDRKVHARFHDAESAQMLAETCLALNDSAGAVQLLSGLPEDAQTVSTRILLGIAFAYQGDMQQARTIADQCVLPKDAGPRMIHDLACLQALVGHSDQAIALLKRSFQLTPPSRLDALKRDVQQDKRNLGSLMNTPAFAEALQTQSTVTESKCSGGKSCAKCPSRSKCAKQQGGK